MCGIAGFYNTTINEAKINNVLNALTHRGPDGRGVLIEGDVGLLHTRLSIIELSALGSQPYQYEHLSLTFNGELYNYQEVRSELKILGYSFQSNSDSEVLIKAFHCWREKSVDHFIGMFAFAVYDRQSDELFLFRDRIGVKPLYYQYTHEQLIFASELTALSKFGLDKQIDLESIGQYFRFGFIPSPGTIYKNVSKLEPAHFLKVTRKGVVKERYWKIPNKEVVYKSEIDLIDQLDSILTSAFKFRMVSDVPVGVFLSGGIDSSLLTAILQKSVGGIQTFTIGFKEAQFDESPFARSVAKHLNTAHTQKILEVSEARKFLNDFYSIYDEPFADTSGIPTACVTRVAKEAGIKVVLSADGGDELFGGYTHYQSAYHLYKKFTLLPMVVRRSIGRTINTMIPVSIRSKVSMFNLEHRVFATDELLEADNPIHFFESYVGNQTFQEIKRLVNVASIRYLSSSKEGSHPQAAMMEWDLNYYLPDDLLVKVDRATMHYGVESREPFLDHRLVEFASCLPLQHKLRNGSTKHIVKELLAKYVPREMFDRRKQGFSIPIFSWFKNDLDQMFDHYLSPETIKEVPFLNGKEVSHELKKYRYYKSLGKDYNIEKVWRMLSLMMWWKKNMNGGY